jgi:hypothetical protein
VANLKVSENVVSEEQGIIAPIVGTILPFAGPITQTSSSGIITTTAPSGWLLCNGNQITESEYPQLYAIFGQYLPEIRNTSSGQHIYVSGTENANLATYTAGGTHSHNVVNTAKTSSVQTNDHGHGVNYNGTNEGSIYHGHNYYVNGSTTNYVSNAGNFVGGNSAFVSAYTHSHGVGGYNGTYYTGDSHIHAILNQVSNNTNSTHSHTFNSIVSRIATSSINEPAPLTTYIHFIVKAG